MKRDRHRWPAEWETQRATWVAWPVSPETWPNNFERVPAAFAGFIAAIARFQAVCVLVPDTVVESTARRLIDEACARAEATYDVHFIRVPVNDSWIRDYGPLFVEDQNGQPLILDFGFNSWGGKYPPWELDDAAAERIAECIGMRRLQLGVRDSSGRSITSSARGRFVLEGGAIDGNGAGTLLTTASCVLNPTRNGPITAAQFSEAISEALGVDQIVWVTGDGIPGDDTDGHIDQFARFVSESTVLVAVASDPDSPHKAVLDQNLATIAAARNSAGAMLTAIPLPVPEPMIPFDQLLPCSYCNFLIVNGAVLVPTFRSRHDDEAMRIIHQSMPDRQVIGVDAFELVQGLGALHCLSMQEPVFA